MTQTNDIVVIEMLFRRDPELRFDAILRELRAALAPLGATAPVMEAPNLAQIALRGIDLSLAWDVTEGAEPAWHVYVSAAPRRAGQADRALDIARTIARRIGVRHGADHQVWHEIDAPLDLPALLSLSGRIAPRADPAPPAGAGGAETPLDRLLALTSAAQSAPALAPALALVRPSHPVAIRAGRSRRSAVHCRAEETALRAAIRGRGAIRALADATGARLARTRLGTPANAEGLGTLVAFGASAVWLLQVPGAA